jgi:hypothetical protein
VVVLLHSKQVIPIKSMSKRRMVASARTKYIFFQLFTVRFFRLVALASLKNKSSYPSSDATGCYGLAIGLIEASGCCQPFEESIAA